MTGKGTKAECSDSDDKPVEPEPDTVDTVDPIIEPSPQVDNTEQKKEEIEKQPAV